MVWVVRTLHWRLCPDPPQQHPGRDRTGLLAHSRALRKRLHQQGGRFRASDHFRNELDRVVEFLVMVCAIECVRVRALASGWPRTGCAVEFRVVKSLGGDSF